MILMQHLFVSNEEKEREREEERGMKGRVDGGEDCTINYCLILLVVNDV